MRPGIAKQETKGLAQIGGEHMNKLLLIAYAIMPLTACIAPDIAHALAENKCKACHDFTTGKNKIGPSLKGVLGRPAGTYPGYRYVFKTYIKGKPWIWTEKRIREWDYNTAKAVKKFTGDPTAITRMPSQFMIGKPEDEIIDYIKKTSRRAHTASSMKANKTKHH